MMSTLSPPLHSSSHTDLSHVLLDHHACRLVNHLRLHRHYLRNRCLRQHRSSNGYIRSVFGSSWCNSTGTTIGDSAQTVLFLFLMGFTSKATWPCLQASITSAGPSHHIVATHCEYIIIMLLFLLLRECRNMSVFDVLTNLKNMQL